MKMVVAGEDPRSEQRDAADCMSAVSRQEWEWHTTNCTGNSGGSPACHYGQHDCRGSFVTGCHVTNTVVRDVLYWVRRHQKRKPFWILLEQQMVGWQWHQLDHMQIICTSLQTYNHAITSPLSFYRPDTLPATQSTVSEHWRH